jgi:hypothetical protein
MVKGRRSKWDKPIQNILEKGSHREEINTCIKQLAHATPDEIEIKIQECIASKLALFHQAEREVVITKDGKRKVGRGLTKEEWYQKKIYDGRIKKLVRLKEYARYNAKDELVRDVDLNNINQNILWEQICNIRDIIADTSDISKVKELKARLKKLEKEYFKRSNLSKEQSYIHLQDKVMVGGEEGTVTKIFYPNDDVDSDIDREEE